jgi:hypothetical protein
MKIYEEALLPTKLLEEPKSFRFFSESCHKGPRKLKYPLWTMLPDGPADTFEK